MPDTFDKPVSDSPETYRILSPTMENVEISASVNEVISSNPGYLIRKGNTFIFLLLLFVFGCTWFIRYPDTAEGISTINTSPLPILLRAQTGARIMRIFVRDNDRVADKQPLVELENSTGFENASLLQSLADSADACIQRGDLGGLQAIHNFKSGPFGDAQPIFNNLLRAIDSYLRAGTTAGDAAAAPVVEEVHNLQNALQTWRAKYVLYAPFSGKVHLLKPLQPYETVDPGQRICTVIPAIHQYSATVDLPVQGIGKVKPGQSVQLMLDEYPKTDFGYLPGTVISIDRTPDVKKDVITYKVAVKLPDRLITSFNKPVTLSPEMTARARIITQDRSLFSRIVSGIIKI